MSDIPNNSNGFHHEHARILLDSFRHWTGRDLLTPTSDPIAFAEMLFFAPFAVVSHDIKKDPIFNYGNQTALRLFEMDWCEFTQMPSRKSAEPIDREERARILSEVEEKGFCEDYSGIRVSSTGRRFMIENAIVWTLVDKNGRHCGQAATFGIWNAI